MAKKKAQTKTRRANNEGSIFQRKDGLWTGSITLGYDDNGKIKRKVVYGKSRLEVANKVAELTNRISNDNYDFVNNNSLSTLMKEWLLVFKKTQVTARTFENNFSSLGLTVDMGSEYLGGQVTRQTSLVTDAIQIEVKRKIRSLKKENYQLLKAFIDAMEKSIYDVYDYSIKNQKIKMKKAQWCIL